MEEIEEALGLSKGMIMDTVLSMGTKLLFAIAIFVIGFWLAKFFSNGMVKVLRKSKLDEGLITFLKSFLRIVLKILVVITAISQVGVQMTSFVALLGAAGLAIGMAFSGTLANFAGGVVILLFKQFKIGDFVEMQGVTGVVKEIQMFNTYLTTTDNKIIILPNGPVANNTIINYTKADMRRVDWSFGIAYGDNLQTAKELFHKFLNEDERILKEPETLVALGSLGDSSVNITVRGWVKTDNYWPVFFNMNERVYTEFKEVGLNIPFPQMDVHLKQNV